MTGRTHRPLAAAESMILVFSSPWTPSSRLFHYCQKMTRGRRNPPVHGRSFELRLPSRIHSAEIASPPRAGRGLPRRVLGIVLPCVSAGATSPRAWTSLAHLLHASAQTSATSLPEERSSSTPWSALCASPAPAAAPAADATSSPERRRTSEKRTIARRRFTACQRPPQHPKVSAGH